MKSRNSKQVKVYFTVEAVVSSVAEYNLRSKLINEQIQQRMTQAGWGRISVSEPERRMD